jgi:hypothetical protein
MTTFLPYRAKVYCNLGHLISGNFADTYLQQAGLIFCRGSVELAGLYQPDIGSPVEFAYTRTAGSSGTAARLPRKLLVLASFADPLRNVTSVQIGCRLSLMRNKRETIKVVKPADSYKAATTNDLPEGTTDYVSPPISASYVASECLASTGITAAALPNLVNQYTVDEFDFSQGYVDILAQLLESEMLVGRMNEDDEFESFSLINPPDALGPVINNTNCFRLSPNGPGELPGEQVITVYDPVPFKPATVVIPPPGDEVIDPGDPGGPNAPTAPNPASFVFSGQLGSKGGWSRSVTVGAPVRFRIDYNGPSGRGTYSGEYQPVQTSVSTFTVRDSATVLTGTETTTETPYAAVAGKYVAQALSNGLGVPMERVVARTVTNNNYNRENRLASSTTTSIVSLAEFAGKLDLTYVFSSSDFVTISASAQVIVERTVTEYDYAPGYVRRSVSRYQHWALTQQGQQAVNAGRDSFANSGDVAEFVNSVTGEPAYVGTEVNVSTSSPTREQRPGPAELTKQVYGEGDGSKRVDANGNVISRTVETDLELGAVESQTTKTFRLPFTAESFFEEVAGGEWASVNEKQRAQAIAYQYGKIQNRLLLGNVKGASMQIPVELMPVRPFAPIYLQADGLTGQYRANGMSWTFDQNGIMGQVDALFWLATGQAGTPGAIWFPMPPGVSSLPTTPSATVNGSPAPANSGSLPGGWNPAAPNLTALFAALPTGVAPVFPSTLDAPNGLVPFNETVALDAVTRSVLSAVDVPFSLVPQSDAADMVTQAVFAGREIALATVPVNALSLAVFAPLPYTPARPSAMDLQFSISSPTVRGSLYVPAMGLVFAAHVPTVTAAASDPNFADVVLLIQPDAESNGSTTFTDLSPVGNTITRGGDTQISTGTTIFGKPTVAFDGSGDWLTAPTGTPFDFGTGDWTVDINLNPASLPGVQMGLFDTIPINGSGARVNAFVINLKSNGKIFVSHNNFTYPDSTGTVSTGTLNKIRVTRTGNTLAYRVNNTTDASAGTITNSLSTGGCVIGRLGNIGFDFFLHGNMTIRVTKGVARTDAEPTAPFPTS